MQYLHFDIENYKGITSTRIEIPSQPGARAVTLIGLNESGKTTLLEAIYSFSPDTDSLALFQETITQDDDPIRLIPRDRLYDFTGEIKVQATAVFEVGDKDDLAKFCREALNAELDVSRVPDRIIMSSARPYNASQPGEKSGNWNTDFLLRAGQQKLFRVTTLDQWRQITNYIRGRLPKIAYFPSFLFDFPEKIYLTGGPQEARAKRRNEFYKRILQDILDATGERLTVDDHIIKRLRQDHSAGLAEKIVSATAQMMGARSNADMVRHTVDKAADKVTREIIDRWDDILSTTSSRREISIDWAEEPGEAEENSIYVQFKIKDGTERYNIADRSLGFRWFFCFLLFTQFRAQRKSASGTLFLFDEPASNLHAKAQEKLLQSFTALAKNPNALIYSTHSHYMIEPLWLDQAYIIKNDAIDYDDASGEGAAGLHTKIAAIKYKRFFSEEKSKATYFQPVLDRLAVRPSQMDIQQDCILLEGKSDYFILSYALAQGRHARTKRFPLIPASGATTMLSVVALLRGWAVDFVVLLDSDKKGVEARKKYEDNAGISLNIVSLGEVVEGAEEIEDLLSEADRNNLGRSLGLTGRAEKKDILRAFQQAAAGGLSIKLEAATIKKMQDVYLALASRLASFKN